MLYDNEIYSLTGSFKLKAIRIRANYCSWQFYSAICFKAIIVWQSY